MPLLDDRGSLLGYRGVDKDITYRKIAEKEKKKLELQLHHADRLATIGRLATGVAHELNEPLSSILGFAELAKKIPSLPPQANNDLNDIVESSLYAREIIKNLLAFSKKSLVIKKIINLNNIIENQLDNFMKRFEDSNVKLIKNIVSALPDIMADQGQLTQVIINLLINAIKAMPEGGTLTIETFMKENFVCLVVEDTGKGIAKNILKNIFDPFFTTSDEGIGLGLSVVHGIIHSHGGTITVDSKHGKYTRFEVQLPQVESKSDRPL